MGVKKDGIKAGDGVNRPQVEECTMHYTGTLAKDGTGSIPGTRAGHLFKIAPWS